MLNVVQRRATKMILSLRNLSHEEKLKRLGMFSLRRSRRLRSDMTEVLKMIQGTDKVNLGKLFSIDENRRKKVVGFSSTYIFPARKREAVTMVETGGR